jgi:hypothetical protein
VELVPVLKARLRGTVGDPSLQELQRLRAVVSLINADDENRPVNKYLKGTKRVGYADISHNGHDQIFMCFEFSGLSITREGYYKLRVDLWKRSSHTNQPDQEVGLYAETRAFFCSTVYEYLLTAA